MRFIADEKANPIRGFLVEDVGAVSKKFEESGTCLSVRSKLATTGSTAGEDRPVETKEGWETKELRDAHSLKKSRNKMAEDVLRPLCGFLGARQRIDRRPLEPDNTRRMCLTALRFHRQQLHLENPVAGGLRNAYGGTRSWDSNAAVWSKHAVILIVLAEGGYKLGWFVEILTHFSVPHIVFGGEVLSAGKLS